MIKLIKNGIVYSPTYLGNKDILIVGDKIGFNVDNLKVPEDFIHIKTSKVRNTVSLKSDILLACISHCY